VWTYVNFKLVNTVRNNHEQIKKGKTVLCLGKNLEYSICTDCIFKSNIYVLDCCISCIDYLLLRKHKQIIMYKSPKILRFNLN